MIASRLRLAGLLAAALAAAGTASAADYDWDKLGKEFCARSLAGSVDAIMPLVTNSLRQEIQFAYARAGQPVPETLFQSYANDVPVCGARTRNAAMIEITRSGRGGSAPSWKEYLVVTPEADGTTRIDDVLFGTRRSDTLRSRLRALAN